MTQTRDYAIERSGWIRTTIELPPGTRSGDIAEIGFECLVAPDRTQMAVAGECRVEGVSKVFLLDKDYRPGPSFWSLTEAAAIPSGQTRVYALSRK